MPEKGLTKNRILAELCRSPHGKLADYVPIGQQAAREDGEFLAHLIAWNEKHGHIRDSKVALPIVSFSVQEFPEGLIENSLAHMALLGPREFDRAVRFRREQSFQGKMRVRRVVERYVRNLEADWNHFDRVAVLHRKTLKSLYAFSHIAPSGRADQILFKQQHPSGSIYETVAQLSSMSPAEAASAVLQKKIPFLVAMGALGPKSKEPDLVLALIDRMSPTELVTNTKMLERLGVKTNPVLRAAFENALERAASSKKNALKTTRAAEAMGDAALKEKLRGVQEKQIASMAVDGNWLVLADKSGSMQQAIEVARHVSATLAKMVKGKVFLVFFDSLPRAMDVTGCSLDEIKEKTKFITAGGSTSIGCGVKWILDAQEDVDGIAIVSDAQENCAPRFVDAYKQLCEKLGKDIPVYLYCVDGHGRSSLQESMADVHLDMQEFDLNKSKIDYYSLPNLVQTMRTNRYSLIDEVMATPLLTLDQVFGTSRSQGKRLRSLRQEKQEVTQ